MRVCVNNLPVGICLGDGLRNSVFAVCVCVCVCIKRAIYQEEAFLGVGNSVCACVYVTIPRV